MPCTRQPIARGWVLGCLIAVGACAGGETVGTDAHHDGSSVTVRITPPVDSLGVGESRRLTIAVTDEDGTRRSAIVKWKSLNPAIAAVSAAGDVTALAEGAVAVVAKVGSRADTASIYVRPGNLSVQPNAVTTVVGEAIQFSATSGDASASGTTVTWSSSNTNVAVVDPDGTVSMVGQGEAILTATDGKRTGTASVSVHQRDIASLRVTPATSTMYPNDTAQLHIAAFDDAGHAMALAAGNTQWSSSDARVATVSDGGVVKALAAGSAVLTVHIGNKTATAAVNVQGVPVASVFVSLETGTLEVGQVTKAKATLADAAGAALSGRAVAWQSSNPAIATVNSLGVVTAVGRGSATISAIAEGKTGSADLTVATKSVASVVISPNPASAAVGQKARLTATVKDASGGVLTGRTITWTSGNPTVASVSANGLVTAVSAGTATISASTSGVSGTSQFQATTVAAASVSVSPTAPNVRVGEDVQLTVTAMDASGNVLASRVPSWSSSNPIVATVSASGRVTGVSKGTATVTATVDGKSAPASVSVASAAPAPVASVAVTLNASSINAGQSTQAVAVTRDASGNVVTGRTITWSSGAPALATVSASGVVSAIAAGSVSISATSEGVSNSATLVITGSTQPVASVSLSAPSTSMVAGQSQAVSVTLKDALGNTLTGRTIAWSSSSTSIATVSPSGQVTAVGAGSATITATSEGKSGTLALKVAAAPVDPPASVAVTAPATTLAINQTTQASAVPKDSKGTPLTGRTATWSSSSPNIATVSATGLITGVAAGTVAIKATVDGVVGTLGITVSGSTTTTNGTVSTVSVKLAQAVVQPGASTQATAVALDARSGVISAGTPTWASSNTSVATVSSSGVVTAVAAGQATITGTISGVSGSGTLTVSSTTSVSGTATATVPTLPQSVPATTVGAPTRVVRLPAGGDLQAALNAARPGDEIRLAAGTTWTGNFVIPATSACSVSEWITVRSDVSDTQLPASGARMTPGAATGLAKIVTNNATAALRTNGPTCGWRLLGLEIVSTNDPTVLNYGILKLGDGGSVSAGEVQISLSKVPQDFILDRLYVHGSKTANVVRCVVLNSGRTAIINSWISDCHSKGWDSQSIEGWNGPGPYLIENNFLSGAGENVMFGGADPGIYGLSPSDITIRGNHVWKDPTWKGTWTVKNLFELKNARRVLVENNVFENNWADAQQGMAIVIKSSQDSCGTCTWQGTTDVTFRYNIVRNSPRGFNVQAVDCTGQACVDVHVQRVRAENNLFENIGTFNGTGVDGFLTLLTHDLTDVALIHNTFVGNLPTKGIGTVMDYGAGAARRLQIDDNVFAGQADYAVFYSGMQVGVASLQAMAGSSWSYQRNVTGNVNPSYVSKFPVESWYPTLAGIGFTSSTDYRLSAASQYKGRGSGGTDPGANIDELSRRTAGSKVGM